MELIPAEGLYDYLPLNRLVCVRDSTDLVHRATRHELITLLRAGHIRGVVRKRQLDYVLLIVPRSRAMALLSPLRIQASAHVTRIRTGRSAKKWKACLDRADSGLTGSHRVVFLGTAA